MSNLWRSLLTASTLIVALAFSSMAAAQLYPAANGIWARGNTLILFARFDKCGAPYQPVQPLISHDGGKTWAASGPHLETSEFEYLLDTGDELLIAGEDIAEGPYHDQFLLRYNVKSAEWEQSQIYDQAGDLMGAARETKNGRLLAWVKHQELTDQGWKGTVYLHQSLDHGRTWTTVKKLKGVPRSAPGLRFFRELPDQSGRWRISRLGLVVEQQQANGKWRQVTKLPLPIQQHCSN